MTDREQEVERLARRMVDEGDAWDMEQARDFVRVALDAIDATRKGGAE